MPTKEWHLITSGPSSSWANLYDRYFLSGKLSTHRERRLYRNLEFDFDPVILVEDSVYDAIKNDSAFIETAFRSFKPLIDAMLAELANTIKKEANHHRVPRPYTSTWHERLENLQKELLFILMAHEGKLQAEAKRQLDAWQGLPRDVKRYDKSKNVSKVKIVIRIGGAGVGAGVATGAAAIATPASAGLSIASAVLAWYALLRTIAGGVQEWRLLNKETLPLLMEIAKELEGFHGQSNHKSRAVAAGAAKALTGVQLMNQVSRFQTKLGLLKGKLPRIKLNESTMGKSINEYLDTTEKLLLDIKTINRAAFEAGGPFDDEDRRKVQTLRATVEEKKQKIIKLLDSGLKSYELEQWLRLIEAQLAKVRASQGQAAPVIEASVNALLALGLSSGSVGTITGISGIDFNSICEATRQAAALDTTGLTLGAVADLEALVNTVAEGFEEYDALKAAKRA